jgi:hypothetical protein
MPFRAIKSPQKIKVPPRAAELAIGDCLQADFLLFLDDARDLAVLDCLEFGGTDRALGALVPRILERLRPQQAADMIGAERWLGSLHDVNSPDAAWPKGNPAGATSADRKTTNPRRIPLFISWRWHKDK